MSRKRKREVDVELAKVYDELADDQEHKRLKAAHTLLSKVFKSGVTSDDQLKAILNRLFRGLCSSRKSARLGFSVALTELLSQVAGSTEDALSISTSAVIDILEAQTTAEGSISGQDERDHHFGRIFGAEAILKSDILFKRSDPEQWKRLLELLCNVSLKKPWLRQECGWVLYTCFADPTTALPEAFAQDAIQLLITKKLIRTPEGVAIWLTIQRTYPNIDLPKSVWKHGHPLATKDIKTLADILKDAKTQSERGSDEHEAQGSASWSANLHFAWDVVLLKLYQKESEIGGATNGTSKKPSEGTISFQTFWQTAVEDGLFATSSSTERKAWGLTLWRKVLDTAPEHLMQHTFTTNATTCLVNALKSSERLLQRCAQRAIQAIPSRLNAESDERGDIARNLIQTIIRGLSLTVSYGDFDQITKTKTMQNILEAAAGSAPESTYEALQGLLSQSGEEKEDDEKTRALRQKTIISLQARFLCIIVRELQETGTDQAIVNQDSTAMKLARSLIETAYMSRSAQASDESAVTTQVQPFVRERLAFCFEEALKGGTSGMQFIMQTMLLLHQMEKKGVDMTADFEDEIKQDVQKAWKKLSKMSKADKKDSGSSSAFQQGLSLLYCLVLFQVYNEETDAVEILRELLVFHEKNGPSKKSSSSALGDDVAIIEILLGFASRPSKFIRRITLQIFDAFASQVTEEGIESLCRVLATKENAQGQQEMFEAGDVDMADGDDDDGSDSDVEEIDSDVEVESVASKDDTPDTSEDASSPENSGDNSDDDEGDEGDEDEEDEEDAELAAFDAALASALGTRPLDQKDKAGASDGSDDSDSDMDDDEMMELDAKLAEVFRARNEQSGKGKKKEAKDAKENIVNFKNRVLDFIDSYLKQQSLNPLALNFIIPLLTLARTTQTKQLADRSCEILRTFCSKCKGTNVPELGSSTSVKHTSDLLSEVHDEACMKSSNAHSNVASQCSILITKVLVKSGTEAIQIAIDAYSNTRLRQLTDASCHVLPAFFTDWNNWCQSMRAKFAKQADA